MRGTFLALLATMPCTAFAQEPLYLRIRPLVQAEQDAEIGVLKARAAREAVWQRAEQRSRLAIASVCTGCLKPIPAVSEPLPNDPAPLRNDGADIADATRVHAPFSLAASR